MKNISVIIPAYNAAKYISEAIESVLNQTYKDLEIIVVDDGSTDNTAEVIKEIASVRYFHQDNRGPAAARNRGIKEAKGEYIAFLDADDIWLPHKLEKQLAKFKEVEGYSLVHADRICVDLDGEVLTRKAQNIPEGWVFNELLMGNFICVSTVVVKKSCFDKVGLFDESVQINRGEDYDMWLRIARNYQLGFINTPLIKYRVVPKSHIRHNIKASYDATITVFLKALQWYEGDKKALKKERFRDLMYKMSCSFFSVKDYRRALSAFLEAAKLQYFIPMKDK